MRIGTTTLTQALGSSGPGSKSLLLRKLEDPQTLNPKPFWKGIKGRILLVLGLGLCSSGSSSWELFSAWDIDQGCNVPIWEFPKIGDPSIVPQIVGSLE